MKAAKQREPAQVAQNVTTKVTTGASLATGAASSVMHGAFGAPGVIQGAFANPMIQQGEFPAPGVMQGETTPLQAAPEIVDSEPHLEISRVGGVGASFVSNDVIRFDATFSGCEDAANICNQIQWTVNSVSANSGNGNPHSRTGGEFSFTPNPTNRPLAGSREPNDPIEYRVVARVEGVEASFDLEQDETDILRQEYIDYQTTWRPTRDQVTVSNAGWNTGNYGRIAVEAGDPGTNYNAVVTNWNALCQAAGISTPPAIGFSSCYRNPQRNNAVGSQTVNSRHTRGRALDLTIAGGANQAAWTRLRTAGNNIAGVNWCACEDGPTVVANCNATNTDHVHVDW